MSCKQVFEKVDGLTKKYLEIWQDVCNIESPTSDKAGVDEVGKYFASLADKMGWDVEVTPIENAGDIVCITMNKSSKEAPLFLSGHIDSVHPKGLFGYPPTLIEGDTIYGPGVTDCKGGVVAAVMAMDALSQCGYAGRPISLILQTDEEMGSRPSGKSTIRYICEKAKDSVAFLNLEGSRARGYICASRKGIISYTFKISGIEAHSSESAKLGANAILEAAHKIIELEKIKDDKGITINCGVIRGGTVPNTVPGYCEFTANIRFATGKQLEWVKKYVKEVAEKTYIEGCSCELELFGFRIMMEDCERNRRLIGRLNEIFEKEGLPRLEPEMKKGGSDAADVTAAGIPCVDCIGVVGGYIHSPKEWADIPSLTEAAKRIVAIAMDI
ncbi:MAG: M20/M25/M40 family metallo-hydrolase [Clostridia bacterium]|nr:M20/M25/M40 family metallo-hydrolase [Clostridia bacterium]